MNEKRVVKTGKYTSVLCLDQPGAGNACHQYDVVNNYKPIPVGQPSELLTFVAFQNGPIQENGVNGCQNEDLLAIVSDRLQGFQSGKFACRENAIALTKIQEALMWLEKRTADREARGVEGKNIV